jgi:hypothetical protein
MSLRPQPIGSIPEQTAHMAHAAFPKGHPYLTLRDHLGTIFQDEDFAALFPAWGYPGLPPWRLALVTMMQFAQFIRICRWLQLIHKDRLAPLENAPFSTLWARQRYCVAQCFR